ncbi:LIM domain containing 2 [Plakobranchus ocellatus]|uniref:LIM domain containing 2 n=1 Tax=Plakobranchus ocellatus TaxID=259542 RepID=A0AAV4AAZ3_9GAST|nr:LIM domain containing 2 [Plakobranchus ocellatus]
MVFVLHGEKRKDGDVGNEEEKEKGGRQWRRGEGGGVESGRKMRIRKDVFWIKSEIDMLCTICIRQCCSLRPMTSWRFLSSVYALDQIKLNIARDFCLVSALFLQFSLSCVFSIGRSKSMRAAIQVEKCGSCEKSVYAMERLEMNKTVYHKACFKCSQCKSVLTPKTFAINNGVIFCTNHYKQLFATKGNYDEGFGRMQHKKRWNSNPNLAADGEDSSNNSSSHNGHHQQHTVAAANS